MTEELIVLPDPLNDGFDQPQEIEEALQVFPADVKDLMPIWEEIPIEFRSMNDRTEWNKFVSTWFYTGWPKDKQLYSRSDVDPEKALTHLNTILRSFQPKHEHKMAAVSWLMSRWYADVRPVEESNEDDADH